MKRRLSTVRILSAAAAIILASGIQLRAQDVFLSVSGSKADLVVSGDTRQQYDFWMKPSAGAPRATLGIFDASLRGFADLMRTEPDTKTSFELYPFDSLYQLQDGHLVRREGAAAPVVSLTALDESRYANRWYPFAGLPAGQGNGWILRVRTLGGDDINTFKLGFTDTLGRPVRMAEWNLLALDLSVCLYDTPPGTEAQIPFAVPPRGQTGRISIAGEEDSELLIRDYFGLATRLPAPDSFFVAEQAGIANRWGLSITRSRRKFNNLTVVGAGEPLLFELAPILVQQPSPVQAVIAQAQAEDCNTLTLSYRDPSRLKGSERQAVWQSNGMIKRGESVQFEYTERGAYRVLLLLPASGAMFPQYWQQEYTATVHGRPTAVITAERTIAAPGETVTLSSAGSSDPDGRPLTVQWFVDGMFRSVEQNFRIAGFAPGSMNITLVVNNGDQNSPCAQASAVQTIFVNPQPYTEIAFAPVVARNFPYSFSASNETMPERTALAYHWRGKGVVADSLSKTVKLLQPVPGDYEIALTVDDQTGASNATYTKIIQYHVNAEPVPMFRIPDQIAPGDPLTLSGAPTTDTDNAGLAYRWSLSNDTALTGRDVVTSIAKPGDYTVTLTVNDLAGVENSEQRITKQIHVNAPPVPAIAGEARSTSSKQQFSASATTDGDQRQLSYAWDFGDGAAATGRDVTHLFGKSGRYVVTLTVDDGQKQTNSVQTVKHTIVINKYPVASFTAPVAWDPAKPIELDGTGSRDPDGFIGRYRWTLDGKPFSGDSVATVTIAEPGDHVIALEVQDNSGFDDAIGVMTRRVHINIPPVVQWRMTPPVAEPDVAVEFDAGASVDPDGAVAKIRWKFSDGSTAEGRRVSRTFTKSGFYSVTVEAEDNSGFSNSRTSAQRQFVVNSMPIVITKNVIRSNSRRVLLDASPSYDADGDPLQFEWKLPGNQTRTESAFYWEAPGGGVFFLTVTVNDGQGKKNSIARETIKLQINRPPVAVVDSIIYACTGQTVLFNGSACFDPDGDAVSTQWDLGDGASSTETNPIHVYTTPGKYAVTLRLSDGFAEEPTVASIPVIVEGSPQAIQSFADSTVCVSTPLEFDGSRSYDPNGPIGSFVWDFGDGSTAVGAKVIHTYSKPGVYSISLTVTGNGSGRCSNVSQAMSTVRVVEGPVADFQIPERISIGESLLLDASPSKPNGTLRGIQWRVQTDSGMVTLAGDSATTSFAQAGIYLITLVIDVETGSTCTFGSVTRRVQVNAPPRIAWKVPAAIANGDKLVLDATGSRDDDGVIIAYLWTIDGKTVGNAPVAIVPLLGPGEHEVELTVTDNSGTSTKSVTRLTTIRVNTKPDPSFALPEKVFEAELLTLRPDARLDADGDTLAYAWNIDGVTLIRDTVRLGAGKHLITVTANDGRGLRNSVDSVQRLVYVIPKPALDAVVDAHWITGTPAGIPEYFGDPAIRFLSGGALVDRIQAGAAGAGTVVFAWAPKGEPLFARSYAITVWDSLRFVRSPEPISIQWNPSNPFVVLNAVPVNRPEGDGVSYTWKSGATVIGVGPVLQAQIKAGRNVIVLEAIDRNRRGAHIATVEYEVTARTD